MTNPSDSEPIEWNRGNPARRCTAHKKNGEQCRRWAIRGGTVCTHHGGRAPAVIARARQRLDEAADRMAKQLLGIAESAESEAVKLAAVRDALDRVGLKPPAQVEVSAKAAEPWEEIMGDIAMSVGRTTRAEHRARRGLPPEEPRALPPTEIVDAEIVEDGPEPHPERHGERVDRPAWAEDPPDTPHRASRELVRLEDAVGDVAAANRRAQAARPRRGR